MLIMQYLISNEHFVFPSGIPIPSLPPSIPSFLGSFRSWSWCFVSIIFFGGTTGKLMLCYSSPWHPGMPWLTLVPRLISAPFSRNLSWKKLGGRWKKEEAGARGWLSLERISSGLLVAWVPHLLIPPPAPSPPPAPPLPSLDTLPNLFITPQISQ